MTLEERYEKFQQGFNVLAGKYGLTYHASAYVLIDGLLVIRNREEIAGKSIEPRVEMTIIPVEGWVDPTQSPEQDKKVLEGVVEHRNGIKPKLVK